jgi:hypothetical protein
MTLSITTPRIMTLSIRAFYTTTLRKMTLSMMTLNRTIVSLMITGTLVKFFCELLFTLWPVLQMCYDRKVWPSKDYFCAGRGVNFVRPSANWNVPLWLYIMIMAHSQNMPLVSLTHCCCCSHKQKTFQLILAI